MTLRKPENLRYGGYDILRLLGAVLVVTGHNFVLLGQSGPTVLGVELQTLGLLVLFCISGHLVSLSAERLSPLGYWARRLGRLMPGLATVTLVSVLVIGPAVTQLSLNEYFSRQETFAYLSTGIFAIQHQLPGVFESNPYPASINGSLWSMPVELICYALAFGSSSVVSRFGGKANSAMRWLAIGLASFLPFALTEDMRWQLVGLLVSAFLISAELPKLPQQYKLVAILVGAALIPIYPAGGAAILLAWITNLIGRQDCPWFRQISFKTGDLSYGVYLYGFIVGQVLIDVWAIADLLTFQLLTLAISLSVASLSWRFVEKPALVFLRKRF